MISLRQTVQKNNVSCNAGVLVFFMIPNVVYVG